MRLVFCLTIMFFTPSIQSLSQEYIQNTANVCSFPPTHLPGDTRNPTLRWTDSYQSLNFITENGIDSEWCNTLIDVADEVSNLGGTNIEIDKSEDTFDFDITLVLRAADGKTTLSDYALDHNILGMTQIHLLTMNTFKIFEVDIIMNNGENFPANSPSKWGTETNNYKRKTTLRHELLHCYGIAHTTSDARNQANCRLMYYNGGPSVARDEVLPDECCEKIIACIYSANRSSTSCSPFEGSNHDYFQNDNLIINKLKVRNDLFQVVWSTSQEISLTGFNIYQNNKKLNQSLIIGKGNDFSGKRYSFRIKLNGINKDDLFFLEIVNKNGTSDKMELQ